MSRARWSSRFAAVKQSLSSYKFDRRDDIIAVQSQSLRRSTRHLAACVASSSINECEANDELLRI